MYKRAKRLSVHVRTWSSMSVLVLPVCACMRVCCRAHRTSGEQCVDTSNKEGASRETSNGLLFARIRRHSNQRTLPHRTTTLCRILRRLLRPLLLAAIEGSVLLSPFIHSPFNILLSPTHLSIFFYSSIATLI